MNSQRVKNIVSLQENTKQIRNISIIAHVDHGKTTLVDCLLASNNVVNRKQVGTIRFCDSREDEREREITMKSSSFSLWYQQPKADKSDDTFDNFLINLIDSPGHIAFRSEVSYALRLTDGALLLVDIVEGVSSQTYTVLKQAFDEKIKCILVINKMDRLIQELKLTPLDAYTQMRQTIDLVNAYLSTLITNNFAENIEEIENEMFFSPEKGNVIFTSALHCWGFNLQTYSKFLQSKNQNIEEKYLWGDYYENPKTKEIKSVPGSKNDLPIFVKYVLRNIWQVYETIQFGDLAKYEKVCSVLGLSMNQMEKNDFNNKLTTVYVTTLNSWLPIETSIFQSVCKYLPNPQQAQKLRSPVICKKLLKNPKLKQCLESCNTSPDVPVIIFITKMISVNKKNINDIGLNPLQTQYSEVLIGFGRVFSGTIKRGQKVYLITPKNQKLEIVEMVLNNIYLVMGQNMEGVQSIPAGNILGIANLDEHVFKTATLSSSIECPQFTQMQLGAQQLLKVNLTTEKIEEMNKLNSGLKKLNQSDPSISISCQKNGEYQIATCGELHLERCINDLELVFSKVKVKKSAPIIQFKETVLYQNLDQINNYKVAQKKVQEEVIEDKDKDMDEKQEKKEKEKEEFQIEGFQIFYGKSNKFHVKDIKQKQNQITLLLPNQCFQMTLRCVGFPIDLANFIEKNPQKQINQKFINQMLSFNTNPRLIEEIKTNFVSFGPNKTGSNIFLIQQIDKDIIEKNYLSHQEIVTALTCGFEQSVSQGALCEEPLTGVCFILESFELIKEYDANQDGYGSLSGQIMSTFYSASQEAFIGAEPRIVECMYLCELSIDSQFMGQAYNVLNKRKACNIEEELNEFSNIFVIRANMPLAESLGFDEEIRSATQSKADYQLSFSNWQILDFDPFYTPTSKEELEDWGEKVDENRAKQIIDNIRVRKINKKIVEDGQKNRTLKRNK